MLNRDCPIIGSHEVSIKIDNCEIMYYHFEAVSVFIQGDLVQNEALVVHLKLVRFEQIGL